MFLPSHLYNGSGSDQKSTGSGSATLVKYGTCCNWTEKFGGLFVLKLTVYNFQISLKNKFGIRLNTAFSPGSLINHSGFTTLHFRYALAFNVNS